jgi:hypothetical protein
MRKMIITTSKIDSGNNRFSADSSLYTTQAQLAMDILADDKPQKLIFHSFRASGRWKTLKRDLDIDQEIVKAPPGVNA